MEAFKMQTRFGELNLRQIEGKSFLMIDHAQIIRILAANQVNYTLESPVFAETSKGVTASYICRMWTDDRTVCAAGECSPENTKTDIARQNPLTIASDKAVDRAFIQLLGLQDVVLYSNLEISDLYKNNPVTETKGTADVMPNIPGGAFVNIPADIMNEGAAGVSENAATPADGFADDEIVPFGPCEGKTYGQVKGTPEWEKTVKTAKEYPGVKYKRQDRQAFVDKLYRLIAEGRL